MGQRVTGMDNFATGHQHNPDQLHAMMCALLDERFPHVRGNTPQYTDFRPGDVRHSQADIDKARKRPGYEPTHRIHDGLAVAMDWYIDRLRIG